MTFTEAHLSNPSLAAIMSSSFFFLLMIHVSCSVASVRSSSSFCCWATGFFWSHVRSALRNWAQCCGGQVCLGILRWETRRGCNLSQRWNHDNNVGREHLCLLKFYNRLFWRALSNYCSEANGVNYLEGHSTQSLNFTYGWDTMCIYCFGGVFYLLCFPHCDVLVCILITPFILF